MSLPATSQTINTLALLDSIHRFVKEIELRADAIEIANIEFVLWDITLENELRRHKAPPVKLPVIRRIEP